MNIPKIKRKMQELLNLAIFIGIIYFMFTHFLIFISIFIGIIFVSGILIFHMMYVLDHMDWTENSFENNTEFAKSTFRWNKLAQVFFLIALEQRDKKQEQSTKKSIDDKCLTYYTIDSQNITVQNIKKQWKDLAKIYHPDKEINNMSKEQQKQTFLDITTCRDKLITLIERNHNV